MVKTICPHCKQEFPETPDEYLGQALECPVCNKEFVCEKAKFCAECGAINFGGALKCVQCGKPFPAPQKPRPLIPRLKRPQSGDAEAVNGCAFTPDDDGVGGDKYGRGYYDDEPNDCFWEDVDVFTPWAKSLTFTSGTSSGRARRKEFFLFVISNLIVGLILNWIYQPAAGIFALVALLVYASVSVRRCHDIGLSGLWGILMFVPVAGLALALCPSQPGENKYGPNPVGVSGDAPFPRAKLLSIALAVSLAVHGLPACILLPSLYKAREAARMEECVRNLKNIGSAMIDHYAESNEGALPDELPVLCSDIWVDSKTLKCPSSHADYVYLGNGLNTDMKKISHSAGIDSDGITVSLNVSGGSTIPVVMDIPNAHGEKVSILYLDGHVETHKLPRKMTSCVEILKALHPGLPGSAAGRIVLENAKKADAQLRDPKRMLSKTVAN